MEARKMQDIERKIDDFKKINPEIKEALKIFEIGIKEYQQAFKFLNEPHIYTSNSTLP